MFTSIRRFSTVDHARAIAMIANDFAPMIMAIEGSESYRLIDTGDGLIGITTGTSEQAIRATDEASAAWAATQDSGILGEHVSIHEGPLVHAVG